MVGGLSSALPSQGQPRAHMGSSRRSRARLQQVMVSSDRHAAAGAWWEGAAASTHSITASAA